MAGPMDKPVVEPKAPECRDCGVPAAFRIAVAKMKSDGHTRIYQCPNCSKLIWKE